MLIWLQYTHLWGSEFIFQNNWLSKCATRSKRNSLHAHWLSMLPSFQALHQMWWSTLPQECYVHQKFNLHITSWFWRGSLRQQQPSGSKPGIFKYTRQSLQLWHWLCIKVIGHTFEHLASIGNKLQLFFSEYLSGFAWFPALVRPNLMVCSAARMHDQHIVAWQYIFVLVPPITSRRLGMEFFCTLYMQTTWWSVTETRRWVEGDSLVRAKRKNKQEIWKIWKAKHPYLGSQGQKIKQKGPLKALKTENSIW
jgi:hypothetical protein